MTHTPAIVVLSESHLDTLLSQFARYSGEYAVIPTSTPLAAKQLLGTMVADGIPVALLVVDHPVSGVETEHVLAKLRLLVPTARRMAVSHWDHFRQGAVEMRTPVATGAIDAFMLLPRGKRDEEFHVAVGELLNDWNATVATPEVESTQIITPERDALTNQLLEYLTGSGHRPGCTRRTARSGSRCSPVWGPTGPRHGPSSRPSTRSARSPPSATWRPGSTAAPTRSSRTRSPMSWSWAPDPPGSRRRSTPPARGCGPWCWSPRPSAARRGRAR
ncbi:hypothetical protein [Serinicoccus marinus]|uniref:hypothetical protein n=1 Tax=Serinicoccus marinus TaxID=247333 RepID=UPI000405C277|nr:hypothetical protein [Serinicoccus marinus]